MRTEELIGKEIIGFKFPSGVYECYTGSDKLVYNPGMDKSVGVVGEIAYTHKLLVRIAFPNGDSWNYPMELVIEQLGTRSTEIFKIL